MCDRIWLSIWLFGRRLWVFGHFRNESDEHFSPTLLFRKWVIVDLVFLKCYQMFLGTRPAGLLQIIFRKDLATFGSQFFYYVKLWKLKSYFTIVMKNIFAAGCSSDLFYQKHFGQIIFSDGTIFATTIFQTRLQKYFCTIYLSTKSVKVHYIVFHTKLYQMFFTKNEYSMYKTQKNTL